MASKSGVSRRRLLKDVGAATVASGAAALLSNGNVTAQQGAPAILANTQAGRKFNAFVKSTLLLPDVVELTARELTDNHLLLRVEAAQTCYSSVNQVLIEGTPTPVPTIVGHGGVGIVEAVGPQAISCRVGDRVLVTLHPACGRCFNCLRMRSDRCRAGTIAPRPIASMPDGTAVYGRTGTMAELAIVPEEYVTPLFTDMPADELAMLSCVGGCGLGMATTNCPVEIGSDVVIFGGGPVGLSAVQGARLKGASRIILVEPIPYRRDLALKVGATDVVDPNQYATRTAVNLQGLPEITAAQSDRFTDALVDHLREMTKERHDRIWAGAGRNGPHHVMEAVGGDRWKPLTQPQGPDATGITVLNQCWELGSAVGTIVTCSVGHPIRSSVSFPPSQWSDGAKHHWGGTGGGTNDRRDIPRYVRLMETSQLTFRALVGKTYPLAQAREAYEVCADRDEISTVVLPNA